MRMFLSAQLNIRRLRHPHCRRIALLWLLLTLGLACFPAPVLADAPGTRGPASQAQGGIGTPPAGHSSVDSGAVWSGVREFPPLAAQTRSPADVVSLAPRQQAGQESGPITWLGRTLNPGNWILDAGMGIFAGIIKMFGGMAQKAATAFLGSASVLPAGCDNAATNFVFCTPASLTYDHPGVRAIWGVLSGIAAGLVTILFTVRLGRMIVEGPRTLATEGKGLLLTFIFSMAFIQATGPICKLLIDFFNGLSNLLLSRAALSFPSQDVGDLNIGSNVLFLVLWVVILLLVLRSFSRLAQIIVLLAMAPVAGALLMDRSTSPRFRSWFEKLIELLLSQINLVIIFIVIAAILQPYQGQGMGDAFVGFLLSIVMIGTALSGKSVIGIAGAAISGGGGGMLSFLRYQLLGSALRGVASRRGGPAERNGNLSAPSSTPDRGSRAATEQDQRPSSRAAGDPSQSAAAQRRAGPSGSFRLSDAEGSLAHRRAGSRYAAATQGDGGLTAGARREQARMRATMMRQRAQELLAQDDHPGADALSRKARLHDRFARGGDIARPSRFNAAERALRRDTHRQALAEVGGMHALERDALIHQIGADEQRLPIVQRDLAMAGATGGATTGLHDEHQAIERRLAANRARLQLITPGEDRQYTPATRAAAAALANERLPQQLRSGRYALRHGADQTSPFVRGIVGASTQDARNELAHSRAVAVRAAQTPADARPPIAPARRRGNTQSYRRVEKRRSEGTGPAPNQGDQPARPSRARSQTIAMLRARRQAMGDSVQDPIPADTPRPHRQRDDAED